MNGFLVVLENPLIYIFGINSDERQIGAFVLTVSAKWI
jgi:hypothetical protein